MSARIALAILTGATLLACWPLLVGRFYASGDMRDVFIPLEQFFHDELLAGRLPSWHPGIAWGFPVIAAAQIGFFYPPLLLMRWLPVPVYLPLILGIHFIALAWGSWFLAKRLGVSTTGALITSLAFTLSSFAWQHMTHLNIILAVAWLPWQFLAAAWAADSPRIRHWHIASLVLILGLPFLAGQLQIPFMMAAAVSIYFLHLHTRAHGWRWQSIGVVGIVAVGAFLLAAVQLLPTLELAHYSSRGIGNEFSIERANQHSFPIYHLPTAVFPRFFGSDSSYWGKRLEIEYGFFIGTVPLLLAFFAASKSYAKTKWWVWLAIISFLLSLGEFSPFRLIGFEPSLWYFSAPARWLLFTTFAGAILAGYGYDAATNSAHHQSFQRWAYYSAIGLVASVIVAQLVIDNAPQLLSYVVHHMIAEPSTYQLEKIASLAESIQTSSSSLRSWYTWLPLLIMVSVSWAIRKPSRVLFPLTLTLAELLLIASTIPPTLAWPEILTPSASVTQLPDDVRQGQARLLSIRPPGGDTGAYFTNPASRATTETRRRQSELLVPLQHTQFGIAGVEWPASLDLAGQAQALDRIRESDQDAAKLNIGAITRLNDDNHVEVQALDALPRATFRNSTASPDDLSVPVAYQALTPTQIKLTLLAPRDGVVIIRDTWFPGWRAEINGQPQSITKIDPFWRGVPITTGTHEIILLYRAQWLHIGLALTSLVAIMALLSTGQIAYKMIHRA